MVNRLQQPTHSYLARSRSAMSLTGDHGGNVHTRGGREVGKGGVVALTLFGFQSPDQRSLGC